MKKADKEKIFNRFGGKCAYTGQPLPADWQIDHGVSKYRSIIFDEDVNRMENLYPALRRVNHYKREKDIEQFRAYMLTFHLRIAKLPKNSKVERRVKYKEYMLDVANAFGITPEKPFNGKFYFENSLTNHNSFSY